MKVYELMAILEKVPSGAEIMVGMQATLTSNVIDAYYNDTDGFTITGGDAEVINDQGDSIGFLSGLAETDQS